MQSYEGRDYSKLLGMLLTSHNVFSLVVFILKQVIIEKIVKIEAKGNFPHYLESSNMQISF